MLDFIRNNFFIIDFAVAGVILLGVVALRLARLLDRRDWILYWAGAGLGLLWEYGCNLQMIFSDQPVAVFLRPLPVHFALLALVHSLWDGGLFLAGALLARLLYGDSRFSKCRVTELALLVAWGQAQELAVELLSVGSAGWEWLPYPWNPTLFMFRGHHITVLPQLIWLVASVVFYGIALAVYARQAGGRGGSHA